MRIEKLARKGILSITSYIPGKPIEEVKKEFNVKRWVKLASNENLLGPSPKVLDAIKKELSNIYLYPESPCTILREALAKKYSLPEDKIVLSNGVDNLIFMIASAFLNEGEEVIMADPTFPVYTNVTQIMGGKPVKVKLKDYTHDLNGMMNRVNEKTKLIFVCNPNNPTGTVVSPKAFDNFLSDLSKRVIVILDEAYGEFVDEEYSLNAIDYIREGRQMIILRTFSKVYGLASLRIGYAIGREDMIYCLYQVRDPFPVNRLAQVAALAALKDAVHTQKSIQMISDGKRYLYKELKKIGLSYVPSQANFIFIDFQNDIDKVFHNLLREGVIIRPGKAWGYPTCARVTIGKMEDNRRFIKALNKILRKS